MFFPIASIKIINHSFSLYFSRILISLGPSAKITSSLISQFEPLLHIPISAASIVLTRKLAKIHGECANASKTERNEKRKYLKVVMKAAFIIQTGIFSIPFLMIMLDTKNISDFFVMISDTKDNLNYDQKITLNNIAKIICCLALLHNFYNIPESLCKAWEKTYQASAIELINTALNFGLSAFISNTFDNHGKLIDYDYSFLATSFVSLVLYSSYAKFGVYDKVQNDAQYKKSDDSYLTNSLRNSLLSSSINEEFTSQSPIVTGNKYLAHSLQNSDSIKEKYFKNGKFHKQDYKNDFIEFHNNKQESQYINDNSYSNL